MAITFDTLGYSKRLRSDGIDESHADAHAEAIRDYVMPELVTKSDLKAALYAQTIVIGGMIAAAVGILLAAIPFLLK
ncbi:hypothetical protein WKW50_16220 [Ochrobactrum sp. GPK 3]